MNLIEAEKIHTSLANTISHWRKDAFSFQTIGLSMKITILIYFRALAGYAIYFEFCRNEPTSLVTNDKIGKLHFVMLLHIKLIGFIGPQSI